MQGMATAGQTPIAPNEDYQKFVTSLARGSFSIPAAIA
jgi:hypothetical protein